MIPSKLVRLALIGTLFTAACRTTPASSTVSADTWAAVNGTAITRATVERNFRLNADPAQTWSDEEALTAKLGILDDLVTEEVLVARARQQNLQVTDADVDTAVAAAKKNQTDDEFQRQLTARQVTLADLREGFKRRLLAQKLLERDVTSKTTPTEQQITDFFNANRAQFNLAEDAVHLAQIVVTPVPDPQPANASGDDATTPEAARAKVAMLMQRLQEGTEFMTLARNYSEDPETAARGGDLGLVPLSALQQAPPALRNAALRLEPGRATVVDQGGGVTIVYVVSREHARQRDLSSPGVRQEISNALRARREELLRTAYIAAARGDATIVNYLAQRVVANEGKSADPKPAEKK
jgi:peptidyl-prolyl cis-trans isomerase SurA